MGTVAIGTGEYRLALSYGDCGCKLQRERDLETVVIELLAN